MKFISITKSINIRPDWASIGAVLKAGTPLDITGAVANSSAAVGILADDAEKSAAEVAVVTEGSIDLAEVTASYDELTDDCIAAIKGIAFIGSDGDPIVPSGGEEFAVKLMKRGSTYSCDKTFAEINAAHTAGTPIVACLLKSTTATSAFTDQYRAYHIYVSSGGPAYFYFIEEIGSGENVVSLTTSYVKVSSGDAVTYSSSVYDIPLGGGGDADVDEP